MNRPKIPAGLYAIATANLEPFEQALRLGEAGCKMIQYRQDGPVTK